MSIDCLITAMLRRLPMIALILGPTLVISAPLWAEVTREPDGVGITEKIGEPLPLDARLVGEDGIERPLREYMGDGPILIVPSYYSCPRLCSMIFRGVSLAARQGLVDGVQIGSDYRILTVSFDSRDTPAAAREKGELFRSRFEPALAPEDWHFLVGRETEIAQVMDAIGFRYKADGEDFSHQAAIVFVTPDGKVGRYMYGIEYAARDYRLGILETSRGAVQPTIGDRIFLACFRYDPQEGKYTPIAWTFMRIGGGLTLTILIALVFFLWRLERKG